MWEDSAGQQVYFSHEKTKNTFSGITRYYANYLRKVTILEKNFHELLYGPIVPKDIKEKLDLLLYNLGRMNNKIGREIFGRPISINTEFDYPLGFCSEIYEFRNMINELVKTNFLKPHEISGTYSLTVEGLIKYNKIKDKYNKINNSINRVTVINSKANRLLQLSKNEKEILKTKNIFISYSGDSEEHIEWLSKLADRLSEVTNIFRRCW